MMGMRKPKTCWTVFKRRAINLRDVCIWLVDLFKWVIHNLDVSPDWTNVAWTSVKSKPFCRFACIDCRQIESGLSAMQKQWLGTISRWSVAQNCADFHCPIHNSDIFFPLWTEYSGPAFIYRLWESLSCFQAFRFCFQSLFSNTKITCVFHRLHPII
jgi:hypothetical protein